ADPGIRDPAGGNQQKRPTNWIGILQKPQEVDALGAEEQLLVVEPTDESKVDVAVGEDEPRDRQRHGGDERKDRQTEDEKNDRPHEQPAGGRIGTPRAER